VSKRILIVEDDLTSLYVLKLLCESFGYETHTARDGAAGLTLLQAQNYTGLILDIYMPIMNGLEVLRQVRRTQPQLPVIMITARAECEIEAMREGASAFLVKPLDLDEMKATIEGLIGPAP